MELLKKGKIAVKKKAVDDLLETITSVENNIDAIMKQKESLKRGTMVAKEMNRLTFNRHTFQHFELGIDLKKLK